MPIGELVTVFNRAPIVLDYVFDGYTFQLDPGRNPRVPLAHVPKIKNQHPQMGAENPYSMVGESLVSVEGTKDCCDPLTPQEWEDHLNANERWNREKYGSPIFGETKFKVVNRPKITSADVGRGGNPGGMTFGHE